MERALDIIRKDVDSDKIKIDNPTQNLESYFLDVVEKAREAAKETSGATSGHRVAAYLRGEAGRKADGAEKILERLSRAASRPPRPASAPQPVETVDRKKLEALAQPPGGGPTPATAPAAPAEAQTKVDLEEGNEKLSSLLGKPKCGGYCEAVIASVQPNIFAIVWLTWKAAFRYRLFWVIVALLLGAVVGLPLVIKHDGTAEGFAQILLTYTLGAVTALLGLCTLWLACGTLARDVEDCQIQMVVVKPVARWQVWLGKWLGLVSLNAALLAVAGRASTA